MPSATAGSASPISPAPSPRFAVSPSPSCPEALFPQHFKLASSSTKHVWFAPASTTPAVRPVPRSTAARLSPISAASSPRFATSPRPNCPEALFPQHFKVVSSSTAQMWPPPMSTVCGATGPEIHGREAVAHLSRIVTAVRDIAQAQLTRTVVAPTLQGRVVEQGAGVVTAAHDRDREPGRCRDRPSEGRRPSRRARRRGSRHLRVPTARPCCGPST